MTTITARLAPLRNELERATIHRLRTEAEMWLRQIGQDQFQPDGPSAAWRAHEIIDECFDRDEFWGLYMDSRLVAVGAVKEADPDFWTAEERAQPQFYLARWLVADPGEPNGYGTLLMRLLAERARARGVPRLRADCWRTNTRLQRHYVSLGWRHIRTEVVEGRGSGWLMELDLTRPSRLLP